VNYHKLFQLKGITNVGLIGTGVFGRSFLVQARLTPGTRVSVVCDRELEVAEEGCLQAGMAPADLKICRTDADANDAISSGKTAVVSDALLLMELAIEVVIEASGMPEAGAHHARTAIEKGKHVVMVTNETDCVVGPILNRLAQDSGLVYTPADGDQPSLLIGLIAWAEILGFETATSVLTANHLKLSTGGPEFKPRVDVGARAIHRLPAGQRLFMDLDHAIAGVIPEILPAVQMVSSSPVPYYLAAGHILKHNVDEGELLTCEMIDHDGQSLLWRLRREQDEVFGIPDL